MVQCQMAMALEQSGEKIIGEQEVVVVRQIPMMFKIQAVVATATPSLS